MQMVKRQIMSVLFAAMFCAAAAAGQAGAAGQADAGRVNGQSPACTGMDGNGMPKDPSDPSCYGFGPGLGSPSAPPATTGNGPRPLIAVVRIGTVLPAPTAPLAATEEMQVVGQATMVKSTLPGLRACFSAGKGWNVKSGAATSTTCMDGKGEVVAYQECKPRAEGAPMVCTTVVTRDPRK